MASGGISNQFSYFGGGGCSIDVPLMLVHGFIDEAAVCSCLFVCLPLFPIVFVFAWVYFDFARLCKLLQLLHVVCLLSGSIAGPDVGSSALPTPAALSQREL